MKGGFFMIDCGGLNFLSETTQTISGLNARMKKAVETGKPVYAYNAFWGTLPMTPIPVMVNADPDTTGTYLATASTLQIRVASNDAVTITNMIPSVNAKKTTK